MDFQPTENILDHFEEEHLPKGEGNWKHIVIKSAIIFFGLKLLLLWLRLNWHKWGSSIIEIGHYHFDAHDVLLLLTVVYIAHLMSIELNRALPYHSKFRIVIPTALVVLLGELLILALSIFALDIRSVDWVIEKQQLSFIVLLSWLGSLISYFRVHRLRGESIVVPALLLFVFILVFGWVF